MGKPKMRVIRGDRQHQRNALNQERREHNPALRQHRTARLRGYTCGRSRAGYRDERTRPSLPQGERIKKGGQSVQ